jgi:hypothetical protein
VNFIILGFLMTKELHAGAKGHQGASDVLFYLKFALNRAGILDCLGFPVWRDVTLRKCQACGVNIGMKVAER